MKDNVKFGLIVWLNFSLYFNAVTSDNIDASMNQKYLIKSLVTEETGFNFTTKMLPTSLDADSCAARCASFYNKTAGCTSFAVKDGFCQMYLLEKDKYRDLDVNSTNNIFVNYKLENTIANYRLLQFNSNPALAHVVVGPGIGNGSLCSGNIIESLKNLPFPTALTATGIGFAPATSVLAVCGGLDSTKAAQSDCYYNKLSVAPNIAWTVIPMKEPRGQPILVPLKEKIIIVGGFDTTGNPVTGMELFNTQNLTIDTILSKNGSVVAIPNMEFVHQYFTCAIPMEEENAFAMMGGSILSLDRSNILSVLSGAAIFHLDSNSWEKLPNLLTARQTHACTRVIMRNTVYLAVIGGSSNTFAPLSRIDFFNMNSRKWETFPTIKLPATSAAMRGSVVLKMNENECNMMLFGAANKFLYICTGNYTWTSMSLTASFPYYIGVPASLMLPCGIDLLA